VGKSGPVEFRGTKRFEVLSRLGEGGMGVVYEALDRERNARVALKTLRTLNAEALLAFKNEFRALQDLQHPNLVTLGELIEDVGQWFFTMELVRGVDFLSWVRVDGAGLVDGWTGTDASPLSYATAHPAGLELARARTLLPGQPPQGNGHSALEPREAPTSAQLAKTARAFDEVRLRRALGQLCLGLSALHCAGKVHRDVKPSNVRVAPDGRVVLLDFGLVTDAASLGGAGSAAEVVGTTAYMAPEQAASRAVGPEADYYAMGVVLYMALTGRLPFSGTALEVLVDKQGQEPPAPSVWVKDLPGDLDTLCVDLLRCDPRARPTGRDLVRRLQAEEPSQPSSYPSASSMNVNPPFVGRMDELAQVRRAYQHAHEQGGVTLLVHGESGVGKSALVREFTLALADDDPHVVVLAGRCYERESVPYKAVDGIVDALSRHLVRVDPSAYLPESCGLLSQVFPVLRRIPALAEIPRDTRGVLDPQELRTRVFATLRALLSRMAERHPMVLCIDDLQWADVDSLALLGELMRPPTPPRLLLLCTVRPVPESAVLRGDVLPGEVRHLHLGSLPAEEATTLASLLLARLGATTPVDVSAIASEAAGHPLFIDELCRHSLLQGGVTSGGVRLDEALSARIRQLEPMAQRLLEIVCVCSGPIAQECVCHATSLDTDTFARLVSLLRVAHLVRTTGIRRSDSIEPYHDRVRDTVLTHLMPLARRKHHMGLAIALEESRAADPEALATHWQGAGDREKAARYASSAAARAAEALAFDRAAHFYRQSLELVPEGTAPAHQLWVKLGDALANAGRGAEAAEAYLSATSLTRQTLAADSLDLKRRAAEQFLRSGHFDRGLSTLRTVLASVGIDVPKTHGRAFALLVWRRARIVLRGMGYRERDASQLSREELMLLDILWAATIGIGMVDPLRGVEFHARYLLLALESGEPYRLSRALAIEVLWFGVFDQKARQRKDKTLKEAEALAQRVGNPHAIALIYMAEAMALGVGKWKIARARGEEAARIFRERCVGVSWELANTQLITLWSLFWLGEVAELSLRVPLLLREAKERGDLYAVTNVRSVEYLVSLAADDPEGARRGALEAVAQWSQQGFFVQHFFGLLALGDVALYAGDGEGAFRHVSEGWPLLVSSRLMMGQPIRVTALHLRARSALSCAFRARAKGTLAGDARAKTLCRSAVSDARSLEREKNPWAQCLAFLVRASVAYLDGQVEKSTALLLRAETDLSAGGMALHAACARRIRGLLLAGGPAKDHEGRALVSSAEAFLAHQHIRNPSRMCALLVPGFPEEGPVSNGVT
jgi:serine/threonine protein kinase/tetratricopeptide (TPR) repeat protein